MTRQTTNRINIYNPTDGARPQLVSSFRHVVLQIVVTGAGAPGDVVKFEASAQNDESPNFSIPSTQDNFYTPVQAINLENGAAVDGNTGFALDTTGSFLLEVNTNLITWINADIASIGGAVFTVDVISSEN
jgi:hypothetical protein